MANSYYYLALQVVLAITAFGLVVTLLVSIFAPRKRKAVVISSEGGDQITVTKTAISSQATHVIEDGDKFVAEKVRVGLGRGGRIEVSARIRPRRVVDITTEGKRLHDNLASGLATVCGDRVFVEAEMPEPAQDVVVETVESLEVPASVYENAARLAESEEPSDITVPLSSVAPPPANEADDAEPTDVDGEVA
jgi:hypothetical protein